MWATYFGAHSICFIYLFKLNEYEHCLSLGSAAAHFPIGFIVNSWRAAEMLPEIANFDLFIYISASCNNKTEEAMHN